MMRHNPVPRPAGDTTIANDTEGRINTSGRSSASELHERLIREIENGGLPPGTRLREVELADRFDVSRTPVREVLKHLEIQGVVEHVPHRGAVVARLDYGQVVELYLMREVLEGTAARLAAQHATQTEIDVMRDMVARDRGLVGDTRELARMNRMFHQQVRDSARNRFLGQMLDNFRLSVALLAGTTLGLPGRGANSVEEHSSIVERIAARDASGAEDAAKLHIHNAFHARILVQQASGRMPPP